MKECARVDHRGQQVAREKPGHDVPRALVEPETRTDCDRAVAFREVEEVVDDVAGRRVVGKLDDDLLAAMRAQYGGDAARSGERDAARSAARRSARAENRGARKL